ncbi:S8 family serine peptidase [Nocardioides salsibiostraticola]
MGNRLHSQRRTWRLSAGLLLAPMAITAAATASTAGSSTALSQDSRSAVVASTSASFLDNRWGDDSTNESVKASSATGSWRAKDDLGSLYTSEKRYGIHQAWSTKDAAKAYLTGRGVDVALIDTGVSPVAGLNNPTQVVNGPDISFESQNASTRNLDGYGHGTHMAGIIAGRDSEVVSGKEDDAGLFVGVAPDARIVNVKVATADGGADVSQIIAAIDWVVQHRNDAGMNIRVINLSYGTNSTQAYTVDPLAYAVENAWRKGIVVVAAAGNDGADQQLTMPAANPYVLAVGAVDHVGTTSTSDDVTASFTNSGTPVRRPDLIAPGKSVVSLRTPGSYSDRVHPEGRVSGDPAQRFFRGSGTSQATAMVSGAAALLLQQRPELTPDQVKYLLRSTANPIVGGDPAQGAGVLDVAGAMKAYTPSAILAAQNWIPATGTGTLEGARGGSHVTDPSTGAILTGEVDAMGNPWDARSWREATTAGTSWSGGTWNGRTWTGSDWSGSSWTARSWRDATWSGDSWAGGDWLARSWRGDLWTSNGWSSLDIASRSWSDSAWGARSWRGATSGP